MYKNKQKYSKEYFELYAKKSLEYCYDNSWKDCFEKREQPDLQSESLNIGIEVTSSIPKRERQLNALFNTYQNDGNYKELNRMVKKIGGKLYRHKKCTILSPSAGLCDFKNEINNLVDVIVNKTIEKLPKYKKFAQNMLYVFTGQPLLNNDDVEELNNLLERKLLDCEMTFDFYFINCINHIFIINLGKKNISIVRVDNDFLRKIKFEALMELKVS